MSAKISNYLISSTANKMFSALEKADKYGRWLIKKQGGKILLIYPKTVEANKILEYKTILSSITEINIVELQVKEVTCDAFSDDCSATIYSIQC